MNIAIIGAGRVGSVLGKLLVRRGEKIVCVVSRTGKSARKAGRFLKCKNVSTSLNAIPATTDLIFITTPHGAVEVVAANLANLSQLQFRKLSVCHASGMLTAAALEPLAKKGATVFSFHPVQTFPRDFEPAQIVPSAKGIYYGVDGNASALRKAKSLATKLQGKIIVVKPEFRAFYHAACVVASNHLTTMLWVLEQMFAVLKPKEKKYVPIFEPIMKAAMENAARTSPAKSLSGPIARGGVETVAQHFDAVQRFTPSLVPYFASMSIETTRLAKEKGSISRTQALAMYNLILSNFKNEESN